MIKDYLIKRKNRLQEILDINTNIFEHNIIAIEKNEKQIKELLNEVDEATNIFSVVVREDNGFKSKEIAEIEEKIAIYRENNSEIEKIISQTKEEIEIINKCLDELDSEKVNKIEEQKFCENNNNIEKKEENIDCSNYEQSKEIIEKLKWCKSLVGVDPRRTIIELDNLIKKYE